MRVSAHLSSLWRGRALAIMALSTLMAFMPLAYAESAADYFVHSLPGAPPGVPLLKMHAGHIEITPEHNGNLFFWLFHNRHLADKQRLVIWLNGGPGCSSEDGALMEIGPYRVRKGGKLELVDGSWDEFANVLFVDNPVGTGFSFVDTDSFTTELDQMANQFTSFLEKFFAIFPEFEHNEIYVAGESYAGQHIPYIARAMLDRNKRAPRDRQWNLDGLLIGNGWISGVHQYPSYLQYAYQEGLLQAGSQEAKQIESQQINCNVELSKGGKDHVDTAICENVLGDILFVTSKVNGGQRTCFNMYDIRLTDTHPSCGMNWPPDLEHVTPYLRQKDVISALHIKEGKKTGWVECNGAVGSAFRAANSKPAYDLLPGLLQEMRIILFSGDRDLICNHLGTEALINDLEFNHGKGFEISPGVWAPRRKWTFENEPAGFWQEARNLTYIKFFNSSHMVPFDYPRRTRDMLDRFMGVDIASIGGKPTSSLIDGEKGPQTSVGGHPNSTAAEQEQGKKLEDAQRKAYYRSGEVALVVVAIAASVWGWFIWRNRRRRAGYLGVWAGDSDDDRRQASIGGMGLEGFRNRRSKGNDLEAADFDESRLDDPLEGSADGSGSGNAEKLAERESEMERDRYAVGDDDDSDDDDAAKPMNGHGR